jgi:hypothetical protein
VDLYASPLSASTVLSVLPVLGAGATQRDERELATQDLEEFDTVAHPVGIEEETVVWEELQSTSV